MKDEDNFTVWANIAGNLEKIHYLLYNTDFEHLFNVYGLQIMKPIYQKLGHENKPNEGNNHWAQEVLVVLALKIDCFTRRTPDHVAEKSCVESTC